jgi:phage major head subunit gpT-like protein
MAVMNTGLSLTGARATFMERLNTTPVHWPELATKVESKSDSEHYRWLGAVPTVREWGTGRVAKGVYPYSYDVTNMKYEATLEVDRDEMSDDQLGAIKIRIAELAERAALHPDSLSSTLLALGDQSGYVAYDGKKFFSDEHESGVSGTQTNTLAPAAVDPDNPTVAEFKTALGAAIAQLLSLKDDQGEPANMAASGLVVITPPTMLQTASEAINATLISSTTNTMAGIARIVAFPRLTDTSKWFLLKTDVTVRPFIFQLREEPEFTAIEENSETGFLRDVFLYGLRARYRMVYARWERAIQSDFTT